MGEYKCGKRERANDIGPITVRGKKWKKFAVFFQGRTERVGKDRREQISGNIIGLTDVLSSFEVMELMKGRVHSHGKMVKHERWYDASENP